MDNPSSHQKLVLQAPTTGRVLKRYLPVVVLVAAFFAIIGTLPSTISTASTSTNIPNVHVTPPAAPGTPGTTVGGVKCKPGVRQLPWSHYAPICIPKWTGNNGGATAPGVTAKTITITYRYAVSPSEQELYSLVAPSVVGTNAGTIQAMQAYIKIFNKYFELYGRKVVLKPFTGKGDFLKEDMGEDAAQAEADAATAKSLGAFADVSILASTQLYDQYLAHEHIIAIGATLMRQSWFKQYAPYEYSPSAPCGELSAGAANFIGRAMAGMPAIYAGNKSMQTETRKFGILYPSNPQYTYCAQQAVKTLESVYHVHPVVVAYSIDVATLASEAASIMDKMKADGVTTIMCACDPVSPILLTQDANAMKYYPEWFWFDIGNAFARLMNQAEWAHALGGGIPTPPLNQQGAYKAFEMADPGVTPSPTFSAVYEPLLLLFDGLQAAGPDLTPQTFEKGFFKLPPSLPGGMFGYWKFGHDVFAPVSSDGIVWWSPTAISPVSGKKGAWLPCNNGKQFAELAGVAPGLSLPPAHQQLQCFGR